MIYFVLKNEGNNKITRNNKSKYNSFSVPQSGNILIQKGRDFYKPIHIKRTHLEDNI